MLNIKKYLLATLAIFCLFTLPHPAGANGAEARKSSLSLGLGAVFSRSEYKQMAAKVWPLPIINYDSERFYFKGLMGGVYLFKNERHRVSLDLSYLPQSFDASDSNSRSMRQLDDRHSTMLAGATYELRTDLGSVRLSAAADVLGTSDGIMADAHYAYPFTISKVSITPVAGALWMSGNYNDYYYGVSGKEARKSGYKKYTAGSGVSPYAGLNIHMGLTEKLSLFARGKAILLNDEITDSPMVDRDYKVFFDGGFTWSF